MTTPTARPARATNCPECKGTAVEWNVEFVLANEETDEHEEVRTPYGPCEICDGRGWFPYETRAQRKAREEREAAEERARRLAAHNERWAARGLAHDRDCPWSCVVARLDQN